MAWRVNYHNTWQKQVFLMILHKDRLVERWCRWTAKCLQVSATIATIISSCWTCFSHCFQRPTEKLTRRLYTSSLHWSCTVCRSHQWSPLVHTVSISHLWCLSVLTVSTSHRWSLLLPRVSLLVTSSQHWSLQSTSHQQSPLVPTVSTIH